jgi:cytochrome c biogenesis protein CcmG, thiol:disulfide interchange protein DsbE
VTPRGRLGVLAATLAFACVSLAGCHGGSPREASYTFDPHDSGIQVNSAALQAFKASADIADCPKVTTTDRVDGGLPSLTLPCLGGGPDVDLAGLRGPLLLNFWAQYCAPCKQESPLLEKLSRVSHGTVQVIGVDFVDPRPGAALAFAKQYGLTYPQLADPEEAAKAPLRIQGLPYTFFVDADGRIVHTQTGPIRSAEELATLVHDHLGVTVPGLAGS